MGAPYDKRDRLILALLAKRRELYALESQLEQLDREIEAFEQAERHPQKDPTP